MLKVKIETDDLELGLDIQTKLKLFLKSKKCIIDVFDVTTGNHHISVSEKEIDSDYEKKKAAVDMIMGIKN